jgi:hemin uptake protein HemP
MSRWRRAAKIDDNQREIVAALRRIPGVTVQVGHDDILVGHRGATYWFEIKRTDRTEALKDSQRALLANWKGHYQIVSTLEEILDLLTLSR